MVEAKCKNCGKSYPSTEFTLDPVYRMMVCRKCVAERRMKDNPIRSGPTPLPQRGGITAVKTTTPAPTARPAQPMSGMTRSRNTPLDPGAGPKPAEPRGDKIKQKCRKCSFSYLYDAAKGYPINCPNCGESSKSSYNFF